MMIQSDFHIFQGGWNQQLDRYIYIYTYKRTYIYISHYNDVVNLNKTDTFIEQFLDHETWETGNHWANSFWP